MSSSDLWSKGEAQVGEQTTQQGGMNPHAESLPGVGNQGRP